MTVLADKVTGCVQTTHVVTITLAGGTTVICVMQQSQTVQEAVVAMTMVVSLHTDQKCHNSYPLKMISVSYMSLRRKESLN